MAAVIYLDTHVAAWLFAGRIELVPRRARELIESNDLLVSPMVSLELQYLFELGRTAEPARVVLRALARDIGLKICERPFFQTLSTWLWPKRGPAIPLIA